MARKKKRHPQILPKVQEYLLGQTKKKMITAAAYPDVGSLRGILNYVLDTTSKFVDSGNWYIPGVIELEGVVAA
jgi:hypothetical protein